MDSRDQRNRRAGIGVERLEGRVALSTVTHVLPPVPETGIGVVVRPSSGLLIRGVGYLYLNGPGSGTATPEVSRIPDVGSSVVLKGSANLTNLGAVSVKGTLTGTGFTAQGHFGGTIVLSNAKGSVTLDLVGPKAPGFHAPSSGEYHFTIEKGTGAYAKDVGRGTIEVTLGAHSFSLVFKGAPNNA